jgi:uroporphyrinogen III methyltransferase/synthase
VIRIEEPPDPEALASAVRRLRDYDFVLFTSANGVERTFRALDSAGLDARAFGTARVGVIGPKTARALEARGIRADLQAKEFVGEELARAVLGARGSKVLVLRALVARDALPDLLRAGGATVDVVAAYETKPAGSDAAEELARAVAAREIDTVLFTSSSTVDSVCDLLGPRAPELLASVTIASIGPVTSETASRRGLQVDVTASVYTIDGLLDALDAHARTATGNR